MPGPGTAASASVGSYRSNDDGNSHGDDSTSNYDYDYGLEAVRQKGTQSEAGKDGKKRRKL